MSALSGLVSHRFRLLHLILVQGVTALPPRVQCFSQLLLFSLDQAVEFLLSQL